MPLFPFYSSWDFARIGTFEIDVSSTAGGPSMLSISTGRYAHQGFTTVTPPTPDATSTISVGANLFATAFKSALDALAFDPSTYTVTFNTVGASTGKYTVTRDAGGTFALTFSTRAAAGLRARRILGFSGDKSGASSYTSDFYPYYFISSGGAPDASGNSPIQSKTLLEWAHRPDVVDEAEADDGSDYQITRLTAPTYYDFAVDLQPKELTLDRYKSSPLLWTWEHFFEHHRRHHEYFQCVDAAAGDSTVHRLRKEGTAFDRSTREPHEDAVINYWRVKLLTRLIGR